MSVLLDAGAGTTWTYKSKENNRTYRRSEGLAIASLEMFKSGMFSSNESQPCQVDADGLRGMTLEKMTFGLQVSESNPIAGLEGRTGLLIRLAGALQNEQLFGADGRPGNMLGKSLSLVPRCYTNFPRLSTVSPPHTRLLNPHHSPPSPLVRHRRWPGSHLARLSHNNRQHLTR